MASVGAAEVAYKQSLGSFDFVLKRDIAALRSCAEPPPYIVQVIQAACAVLGLKHGSWDEMCDELRADDFFSKIASFEPPQDDGDRERLVELLQPFLMRPDFSPKCMAFFSQPCAALCSWCRALFVHCGGSAELGTAVPTEEVLSAAREVAAGARATVEAEAATAAAAKIQGQKTAAELRSQRSGARQPAKAAPAKAKAKRAAPPRQKPKPGGELVVRSMISGEVVTTLKDVTGGWTSREVCRQLSGQLAQQRGCTYQLYSGDEAVDNYKTLSELAIDTSPGGGGEVQFVAVSFVAADQVLTEAEAAAALEAAHRGLDSLSKNHIGELRSFAKPPAVAQLVVQAVCLLLGYEESWTGGKKMFADPRFLQKLVNFDTTTIPDSTLMSLKWYVDHSQFKPEHVARVSMACERFCRWCIGVYECAKVVVQQNVAAG